MTINYDSHILDSMPIGVIVTDLNGNIQAINKHSKSLMNFKEKSINYQNISALLEGQSTAPVRSIFSDDGFTGINDYKIKRNGRILEMAGAPVTAESGVVTGMVFIIKDITETEKRRETEKQQGKNEAFGELSAYIAHEIRNPLGSIELFASLLKKELTQKNDIRRVNQILAVVKSVEDRISRLICSSETCQIPVSHVNIHEILKDILLFSEQITDQETVFLSTRYADIDPIIECNPDIMKQVFLNLIMNALQAMPEGKRLDIITHYLPSAQLIEIHFVDNSPPASKNIRFNIYGNLSQTDPNNSGLGLAIVHNIVTMQKGSIRIEYTEESGTAFILSFPVLGIAAPEMDSFNNSTEEKAANA
jgi:PAS domain S-box-containing protein